MSKSSTKIIHLRRNSYNFGKNRLCSIRFLEIRNNKKSQISATLESQDWDIVWTHEKYKDFSIIKIGKYINGTGVKPSHPPYVGSTGLFNTIVEAYLSFEINKPTTTDPVHNRQLL